jgi:hypothetical protein
MDRHKLLKEGAGAKRGKAAHEDIGTCEIHKQSVSAYMGACMQHTWVHQHLIVSKTNTTASTRTQDCLCCSQIFVNVHDAAACALLPNSVCTMHQAGDLLWQLSGHLLVHGRICVWHAAGMFQGCCEGSFKNGCCRRRSATYLLHQTVIAAAVQL